MEILYVQFDDFYYLSQYNEYLILPRGAELYFFGDKSVSFFYESKFSIIF